MRRDYAAWLEKQKYVAGTITAQIHRTERVEKHYGDLEQHYATDRLEGVISALRYTTDDQRRGRPNPSKIPFDGDIRNNLASYRNAVERYRKFLASSDRAGDDGERFLEIETGQGELAVMSSQPAEELGERIGLERDMQAALRRSIGQLDQDLVIIDDGAERSVESGFIDITAQDSTGAVVVIELKAGAAGQRAVAQILSYMGDIAAEEPEKSVRGILVASQFDNKAIAAARMVPTLSLRTYGVQFRFTQIGQP